jgi:hypothetical protein
VIVLALRRISLVEVVAGVPQVRVSVVNETEGVACRVCVDLPAVLVITGVERRCAELEDLLLGLVEIPDSQVKVELLRAGRVGPSRWLVVLHPLEAEHDARAGVEGRPVLAGRPPGVGLVDHAAKERLVELSEFQGV